MHPFPLLLLVALLVAPSAFAAQGEPASAPATETATPSETSEPPAIPASTEKAQVTMEAAMTRIAEALIPAPNSAAPANASPESAPVSPPVDGATAAAPVDTAPVATPGNPPATSPAPPPSSNEPVRNDPPVATDRLAPAPTVAAPTAPAPSPAPPAPATAQSEARVEQLAARFSSLEQLLLAQHDHEMNRYRDTIRLMTIFGSAFAGVCFIGLLVAAFLNYRALLAVQNIYTHAASAGGLPSPASGLLPAAATTTVPGIERVQASGQRFQSRMTGLEQRLAELEHLAGRDAPLAGTREAVRVEPGPAANVATADETGLVSPPTQVIPRAMILVHKAQALANLGKLSEALATLDEASAFDEARTEVYLARGQVLEKLGRLGDALRAYDTAVDVDDHNTSALLLKAGVLNRQERFSEALACYERALEVHRAAV